MPETLETAWRCTACRHLIYNTTVTDGKIYPTSGAPVPRFLSAKYPQVCRVCYELHWTLFTTKYFHDLERTEPLDAKQRPDNFFSI